MLSLQTGSGIVTGSGGIMMTTSNQSCSFIPISKLSQWNIEPPKYQRFLDIAHENDLYEKINPYPCFQPTPIVLGIHNHCIYVADGQHRLRVYKRLWQDNRVEFPVFITLVTCTTNDELFKLFQLANGSRPFEVPSSPEDMNMAKDVAEHFAKRYKKIFKVSLKPKAPHTSINTFAEALGRLAPKFPSSTELIRAVEELNDQCKNMHHDSFGQRFKDFQKFKKDAREKGGFYLGVFSTSELWVDILLGTRPAPEKRKTFNKAQRKKVWDRSFGPDQRHGQCYACQTKISIEDFDMGHKIALKMGGSNQLSNIEPICRVCNSSCGTMDLDEFKKQLT